MNNAISIVIPAYNEESNLVSYVEEFIHSFGDRSTSLKEILIIENGSRDKTWEQANILQKKFPQLVKAVQSPIASYGEAIKLGINVASAPIVSILELDFLDKDFLLKSAELVSTDRYDFVVASKRHPESLDQRPLMRRVLTFGFNVILKLAFSLPVSDTHGLKTIKTSLAKKLTEQSKTSAEVVQTEFVLLAHKWGHKVGELPIQILEKRATPISIRKRIPKVLRLISELKESASRYN